MIHKEIQIPDFLSDDARACLAAIFNKNPEERVGISGIESLRLFTKYEDKDQGSETIFIKPEMPLKTQPLSQELLSSSVSFSLLSQDTQRPRTQPKRDLVAQTQPAKRKNTQRKNKYFYWEENI